MSYKASKISPNEAMPPENCIESNELKYKV